MNDNDDGRAVGRSGPMMKGPQQADRYLAFVVVRAVMRARGRLRGTD